MAAMLANDGVGQRSGIMPLAGLARSQKKRKSAMFKVGEKKLGKRMGSSPPQRRGEP